MSVSSEKNQQDITLPPDAYPKAMNFIGQNLLSSLAKTLQDLPPPLRKSEVVLQGLAAFLSNVLHKQFPQDQEARQQVLEHLNKLVRVQLADIEQLS